MEAGDDRGGIRGSTFGGGANVACLVKRVGERGASGLEAAQVDLEVGDVGAMAGDLALGHEQVLAGLA